MTQNFKPQIIKKADKIVETHLSTGEPMTSLIIKQANDDKLNIEQTHRLIAQSNKRYILKTGSRDVPVADPNLVMDGLSMYNRPTTKAASYSYSEYSNSNSMSKSASIGGEVTTSKNVVGLMRKLAHDDLTNIKEQKFKIDSKSSKMFKVANEQVEYMKRVGYDLNSIKAISKVANEDLLDYVFNSNSTKVTPYINKDLYNVTDKISKLASSIEEIDLLIPESKRLDDELTSLHKTYNKLKNTGEIMIHG